MFDLGAFGELARPFMGADAEEWMVVDGVRWTPGPTQSTAVPAGDSGLLLTLKRGGGCREISVTLELVLGPGRDDSARVLEWEDWGHLTGGIPIHFAGGSMNVLVDEGAGLLYANLSFAGTSYYGGDQWNTLAGLFKVPLPAGFAGEGPDAPLEIHPSTAGKK